MIKIAVKEPKHTKWKAWREACESEQKKLNQDSTRKIDEDLYKGKKACHGIRSSFFFTEDSAPFFGKCVYCEENIFRSQNGDVEHFRPKGAVEDIDFNQIRIGSAPKLRDHPGYYWLTYDWKNLIPACILCNRIRTEADGITKVGKWKRFPVIGKHATKPGQESKEKPLLINPASDNDDDDPSKHLEVSPTGAMVDLTPRGKACIEVFGLNLRGLPNARKRAFNTARKTIASYLRACEVEPGGQEKQDLENEIMDCVAGKAIHSAAGREGIKVALQNANVTVGMLLANL